MKSLVGSKNLDDKWRWEQEINPTADGVCQIISKILWPDLCDLDSRIGQIAVEPNQFFDREAESDGLEKDEVASDPCGLSRMDQKD
jgi:hypothetical protein